MKDNTDYEIIISTLGGLFRYNMGDRVRQVGETEYGVKKIAFSGRDYMFEPSQAHIYEEKLIESIKIASKKSGIKIYKYLSFVETLANDETSASIIIETKNNKPIWVAWSDSGTGSVSLSSLGITNSNGKVTEVVPDYDTGEDAGNVSFEDMFKESVVSDSVTLGDVPVFIEETDSPVSTSTSSRNIKPSSPFTSQPTRDRPPRPTTTRPTKIQVPKANAEMGFVMNLKSPREFAQRIVHHLRPYRLNKGSVEMGFVIDWKKSIPIFVPGDC